MLLRKTTRSPGLPVHYKDIVVWCSHCFIKVRSDTISSWFHKTYSHCRLLNIVTSKALKFRLIYLFQHVWNIVENSFPEILSSHHSGLLEIQIRLIQEYVRFRQHINVIYGRIKRVGYWYDTLCLSAESRFAAWKVALSKSTSSRQYFVFYESYALMFVTLKSEYSVWYLFSRNIYL